MIASTRSCEIMCIRAQHMQWLLASRTSFEQSAPPRAVMQASRRRASPTSREVMPMISYKHQRALTLDESDGRDDGAAERRRGDDHAVEASSPWSPSSRSARTRMDTDPKSAERAAHVATVASIQSRTGSATGTHFPPGRAGPGCVVLRRMHTYRSERSSNRC